MKLGRVMLQPINYFRGKAIVGLHIVSLSNGC